MDAVGMRMMKRAVWGVFLIMLGVIFLLERYGAFHFHGLHAWWPLVFFFLAASAALEGKIGSTFTMVLLGTWFLSVANGWWGLTWTNSWPLALIAVGCGMVVKALTGEGQGRPWGGVS